MANLFGTPIGSQQLPDESYVPRLQTAIASTDPLAGTGPSLGLIYTVTPIWAAVPPAFAVERTGRNPQRLGTGVHPMPLLHKDGELSTGVTV
jgi:hypothetical protein